MTYVELKPVYGYGWEEAGATIDTPPPFSVQIQKFEMTNDRRNYSKILGKVDDAFHRYGGKWAYLNVRSLGDAPSYNVKIYEAVPAGIEEAWREPISAPTVATGFAEIERSIG
jgi:hypothetical protein